MYRISLILLPIVFAIVFPARAADEESRYLIWGLGQSSCNKYNQARAALKIEDYKTYVAGYLTAYNAFMPETYNITPAMDMDAVMGWLAGHCDDHRTANIAEAMHQFSEEMYEKREKAAQGEGARWP